jgi:hypothetical protein
MGHPFRMTCGPSLKYTPYKRLRNPNSHPTLPKPKAAATTLRPSRLTLSLLSVFFLERRASIMSRPLPAPVLVQDAAARKSHHEIPSKRCRSLLPNPTRQSGTKPPPLPARDPGQAVAAQVPNSVQDAAAPNASPSRSPSFLAPELGQATATLHARDTRPDHLQPPALRLRPDLRRRRRTSNPLAGVGHPMGNALPTWGQVRGIS